MAFYGNVTDTSHTHFQFDRTFSSRTEMDRACALGLDGIYAGRFVLVKYDKQNGVFQGDILYGFQSGVENDGSLYMDTACTQPYVFTTYTLVTSDNTISTKWNRYYDKATTGNFYFRLPSADYFNDSKDYWVSDVEEADDAERSDIIGINTIVRLKDVSVPGLITSKFLKCTGTTSGENATWEELIDDQIYQDYYTNFQLDLSTYQGDFDSRGYDATVWQKVYGEGIGKFVLVARLNGATPAFELVGDPPSMPPTTPYIDSKSTDSLYRVHVPVQWGFRIKEAENINKSDVYDDENQKDLAIYMNLGSHSELGENLYHVHESHLDTITDNNVYITPTGKSGNLYSGEEEIDTQELSIDLPIIGNVVDEAYTLIYGQGNPVSIDDETRLVRARDIEWYEANSNFKDTGISALGGKTYDLTTLAGNVNTFHKRLGQNVYTLEDKPALAQRANLDPDYIYYVESEDKYYRIGYSLSYTDVPLTNVHFRNITLQSSQEFTTNTYYVHTVTSGTDTTSINITEENLNTMTYNSNTKTYTATTNNGSVHVFTVAVGYSNSVQYAVKDISIQRYKPANITYYTPGTYYYISGNDYILDTHPDVPTDMSQIYCTIDPRDIEGHTFSQAYRSNYFYRKENNNYILATESVPLLDVNYYFPDLVHINSLTTLYQKDKYYILENGEYKLDEREYLPVSDSENNHHYVIKFEDTPTMGRDAQGHIVLIYNIAEGYPKDIWLYATQQGVDYYLKQNNDFIHISNLEDLSISSNQFYYRTSTDANETVASNRLFIQGKYYRLINNKDYHLEDQFDQVDDADSTVFYSINDITYLTAPFYEASKYYYKDGDFYHIDNANPSEYNQHYTKDALYVKSDTSGRCLIGMEWNDYSLFIPASVELGILTSTKDLIPMDGVVDDSISLHGALLKFDKIYNPDDVKTRDLSTVMGAINTIQDLFYTIKHLIPGRVLYVNEFGQITSSEDGLTYEDLTKVVNKVNTNIPD